MTGMPTLAVYLEDGAGAFTNNITAYVELASGWDFTRGRVDENATIEPGVAHFTLTNRSGEFTLGASNFNGITVDKRIQVKETVGGTTYTRFTGYVQEWPTEWESALGNTAKARITAVDRQSRWNRRKLRSVPENEVLVDSPARYYTLGEAAGSTSAGDTSGNGGAPLKFAGTGTAPVFGAATGPGNDGLTAVTLAGGQYLSGGDWIPSSTSVTIEFSFLVAAAPASDMAVISMRSTLSASGVALVMTSAGKLQMYDGSGSTVGSLTANSYADGATHWCTLTQSGGTWTLYVDAGSSLASGLGDAISTVTTYILRLGAFPEVGVLPLTGVLAQFATFNSVLSTTRITNHYNAALNGVAGETSDQRVARLLSYANVATADQNLETGVQTSVPAQATAGQSVADALAAVVDAEGGVLFIAGDGKATFQNRNHRVLKATGTPSVALTGSDIDPSVVFDADKDYLVNIATGVRDGGAAQTAVNTASVAKYEAYPADHGTLLVTTDDRVLDLLDWQVNKYGDVAARVSQVTLDLLTLPQATVQSLLALELGDCFTIGTLPSQAPASTLTLIVEGIKEDQQLGSSSAKWTLTLNTAPASLFYAPIVDTVGATCDTGYPVYF